MNSPSLPRASYRARRSSYRLLPILRDALRRPLFFIALLYSVAICYERIIEIEVFKPYRILGLLLIGGVLVTGRLRLDKIGGLISAYLAIGIIVSLPSIFDIGEREDIFVNTALLWIFNVATYIAISTVVRSRRDLIVLAVVHSVALLTAAYGIAQEASAAEFDVAIRQFGDFKNPANAAISMLFSCLVILAVLRKLGWKTPPFIIFPALAMLAVPAFLLFTSSLTGSRSGFALLLIGLLYFLILITRRHRIKYALAAGIFATIVFAVSTLGEYVNDYIGLETNVLAARVEKKGLDTARLYLWRAGLDAWIDSYGLGLGIARYPEVHKEYFAPYAQESEPRWLETDLSLHNDYVIALVEHGILGFVLFVMLCVRLTKTAKAIKDREVRAIALSVLLGIAFNSITHASLPYFAVWFYFALMISWQRFETRDVRMSNAPIR